MVQRGWVGALAALGMTVAVGGCGVLGSDSDRVSLRLVAADYGDSAANSSTKYWDKLTKAYEEKHPDVDVQVSVYSWNDVDSKVKAMVDDGNAPDMAQIGSYADYADRGLLYKAGDLLSIPTQADFVSQLANAGKVRGQQYGMPFASSTRLLFYNKGLFAKAGISAPPTTWDELAADAAKLKDAGVSYPYALPLGPEEAQAEAMQWMLSGGGGYTSAAGTYSLDSVENVQTFEWLQKKLVDKGLTGPVAPAKLNRATVFSSFAAGDVGMLIGHPSLMKMARDKGVQYGMVPMPGKAGVRPLTMGVADWMTAFKQHGNQSEIGKFLDFVYDEDNVLAFSREYDLLPVTSSASAVMSTAPEDRDLEPFLEQLPLSESYPVGRTSWATVAASIKKGIGSAVAPGVRPDDVLRRLETEAMAAESGVS
ncbi:sn-glycerol-3-phosphate-binding periplasmic protein [Streptomyces acidiscabies]|nr:sn-glycerol-3-phosphate-binding periplasmic protein [Streptomyces acidiscabies]GAV41871.1 sn-glycerol-3-phosphate-binding periplasmic protein [Streptomyces acidiscabies]